MDSLDATLERLKTERDEADRRYNDALTAVDRAIPGAREWPSPVAPIDDSQLAALNHDWAIIPGAPANGAGWKGRLTGFIWRVVAPYFERQLTFNSRLIDHLNRQVAAARAAHTHAEEETARLREQTAALAEFHARLLGYLQQVTAYVDTRDRESAGGSLVLNASLSGLAENFGKHWESLTVRDTRRDARADKIAAEQADLRSLVALAQQASLAVKRELESVVPPARVPDGAESRRVQPAAPEPRPANREPRPSSFQRLDSYKYVGFEDQFRGSRDAIRARLESYLPFFAGASDVLDVGCGRGEFLELLSAAGISNRGIDLNHEMAELCRARGLEVAEADAVSYLTTIPDGSLGGLFAAQVVEHLQPDYLLQFLELAFHKIRPGGRIVLETLNPACWVAFFESYIRDITHVWPLHPETLKYLVTASGFSRTDIEYRSPVPPQDRLQTIARLQASTASSPSTGADFGDLVETFNANVDKLNARLFTHLDYAVIGTR
jgi:SAM-dependent methyltransferase